MGINSMISLSQQLFVGSRIALVVLLIPMLLVSKEGLAEEEVYTYDIKVEGMACAFCAYNVSKRLQELPGVVDRSVVVDLGTKQVELISQGKLEKPALERALADSGFSVANMEWRLAPEQRVDSDPGTQLASVALPIAVLDTEFGSNLLDVLGSTAAQRRGRLLIRAPLAHETTILKPLLGGRQQTIPVDYQDDSSNAATVTLWVD